MKDDEEQSEWRRNVLPWVSQRSMVLQKKNFGIPEFFECS